MYRRRDADRIKSNIMKIGDTYKNPEVKFYDPMAGKMVRRGGNEITIIGLDNGRVQWRDGGGSAHNDTPANFNVTIKAFKYQLTEKK